MEVSKDFCEGLVSVIIPTYNRSKYLIEAINSVFLQVYRPIELIIIDDGSTDDTLVEVEKWKASHSLNREFILKVFSQGNNGAQFSRNLGLANCNGEYIQFLDSDDLLEKQKILDAITAFKASDRLDFAYCLRGDFWDGSFEVSPWNKKLANLEIDPSPSQVALYSVWTALPVFKRDLLLKVGPWNEELSSHQDWEYIARASYYATCVKKINKIQAFCRNHSEDRISVNTWGQEKGIRANACASSEIYKLVILSDSSLRYEAEVFLTKRLLSCARVAAVAGHADLAREILSGNKAALEKNLAIRTESLFLKSILLLPDIFLNIVFKPIFYFKKR